MKAKWRRLPRKRRNHQRDSRRGAAVVEFAIIAPLFFLLVVGCIEFGRALMVQQILTNASRVGAREAITLNSTESEVINATSSYATNASLSGVVVSVNPSPAAAQAGDMITVNISVPFGNVSWMPTWFLGGTTLNASSVMRKEGFE